MADDSKTKKIRRCPKDHLCLILPTFYQMIPRISGRSLSVANQQLPGRNHSGSSQSALNSSQRGVNAKTENDSACYATLFHGTFHAKGANPDDDVWL